MTTTIMRWAKVRDWYGDQPHCRYCGTISNHDCAPTTCRACGTRQCLRPHQCYVCYVGYLDGVSYDALGGSDVRCGYARCDEQAVAEAPRVRRVCAQHLLRAKRVGTETLVDYIASRIAYRNSGRWSVGSRWVQMPEVYVPGGAR